MKLMIRRGITLLVTIAIVMGFSMGSIVNADGKTFTTQPQSGTCDKSASYAFTWAVEGDPIYVTLQRSNSSGSWDNITDLSGKTTYSVTYLSSDTNTYRLLAGYSDNTEIYSNEFTVTWTGENPRRFTTQPQSGTCDKSASYSFTWAIAGEDPIGITLQCSNSSGSWTNITDLSGKTTYSVSYLGYDTDTYRLRAYYSDNTEIISNEFTVTWIDSSTYTVTVQNDGNGTASADVTSGAAGTTVTLTATPSSGYQFKEWQVVSGGVTITSDKFTIGTANVVVKAIFEEVPANRYTVTFETNGGSAVVSQSVTDGSKATKPADPTKTDYTFDGWYADATFAKAFDFNTAITADTTIYAKWKENAVTPVTYTVSFEVNGGSAIADQNVTSGTKATKPSDPTKADSTFDGWYQDATFTVAFDFDTVITADSTIYAKWKSSSTGTVYYTVVSGANGTVTQGSDFEIQVKRSADDDKTYSDYFTGVKIDDKELVNGTDYTAVKGSVIITIKAATIQNLSAGGHTITVTFKDGTAVTSLNVKAASSGGSNAAVPSTGETISHAFWVGSSCMTVAVMLFAVVLVQKKRKNVQH